MDTTLSELLKQYPLKVKGVLNLLVESPYFYREDNDDVFMFLRRHYQEFSKFYEDYFGWQLIIDNKCARVYKEKWYNEKITPSNRMLFNFSRRDECIAFMILLEFFEQQLEENSLTIDDKTNLRFRFGDFLQYCNQRFSQVMAKETGKYNQEYIRANILRTVMPELVKYRFLKELTPPKDMDLQSDDVIYEALPALYHYNTKCLSKGVSDIDLMKETGNLEENEEDILEGNEDPIAENEEQDFEEEENMGEEKEESAEEAIEDNPNQNQ